MIELTVAVAALAIIAAVVIPAIVKNARKAHGDAAIGAIRTIVTAQSLYKDGDPDRNGIHDYAPTLDVLAENDPDIAARFAPDPRDPDPGSGVAASLAGSGVLHCCA